MIRVVVAEDHPVFLIALETLLSTMDDVTVVGISNSIAQLRENLRETEPEVALVDLTLVDGNILREFSSIRMLSPKTRFIALTSADDQESAIKSISEGMSAYLMKSARPEEIKASIYATVEGKSMIEGKTLELLLNKLAHSSKSTLIGLYPQLSRREGEILERIAEGKSNSEIANEFVLSLKTVRNHVSNILVKLGVNSRAAAIVKVRKAYEK